MKYVEFETNAKRPRYALLVGLSELNVLKGLLDNASMHMPMAGRSGYKTGEYMSTARTIRDMNKEVNKAVKIAAERGEDGRLI